MAIHAAGKSECLDCRATLAMTGFRSVRMPGLLCCSRNDGFCGVSECLDCCAVFAMTGFAGVFRSQNLVRQQTLGRTCKHRHCEERSDVAIHAAQCVLLH